MTALKRTIVVDLDGTLIFTDMLVENLFLFLKHHPLKIFSVLRWFFMGKVTLKTRLADAQLPNPAELPYNQELIRWLLERRREGCLLVLATASDQRIANSVAEHLNLFDEALGTQTTNLSSHRKCKLLVERFGEAGFEYIGNSRADLAVWRSSSAIYVANPGQGVLKAAARIGSVAKVFSERKAGLRTWARALRLHQWLKNLLIFVPLLASHRFMDLSLGVKGALAFIAFGACASSVYLLNDLLDLSDDRNHPTKRYRPLAAGSVPIIQAVALIPVLLALAVTIGLVFLPITFCFILLAYYGLTLTYSLALKRIVMLDVVCLALLYSIRVVAGATAMSLDPTFWILAFCMFIFLSLAFVKRYTELLFARTKGKSGKTAGRGYYPADLELLASLGGSSGYISALVLVLYIRDAATSNLYSSPQWMWAACPLLLFWLSRVWLLAHRGQMNDDPIIFAIRDRVSRWIGVAFLAAFAMAALT
jgi:4-hydroxybenzoate polyprenyltransferase